MILGSEILPCFMESEDTRLLGQRPKVVTQSTARSMSIITFVLVFLVPVKGNVEVLTHATHTVGLHCH